MGDVATRVRREDPRPRCDAGVEPGAGVQYSDRSAEDGGLVALCCAAQNAPCLFDSDCCPPKDNYDAFCIGGYCGEYAF